jgi:hypothetical protein
MYTLAHAHFAEFDDVPAVDKLKVKPHWHAHSCDTGGTISAFHFLFKL